MTLEITRKQAQAVVEEIERIAHTRHVLIEKLGDSAIVLSKRDQNYALDRARADFFAVDPFRALVFESLSGVDYNEFDKVVVSFTIEDSDDLEELGQEHARIELLRETGLDTDGNLAERNRERETERARVIEQIFDELDCTYLLEQYFEVLCERMRDEKLLRPACNIVFNGDSYYVDAHVSLEYRWFLNPQDAIEFAENKCLYVCNRDEFEQA